MKIRSLFVFLLTVAVALGVLTIPAAQPVLAQGSTGYLRFTHGVAGGPAVDIYMGAGKHPAVANLEFGSASQIFAFPSGTYTVAIRPAGDKTQNNILRLNVAVPLAGLAETVIMGEVGGTGARALRLGYFRLNMRDLNGQARVYVIHAAPNASRVDALAGADVLTTLSYGQFDGPFDVDAGSYNLAVAAPGNPDAKLIELNDTALAGGTLYSVIALGTPGALVGQINAAIPLGSEPPAVGQTSFLRVTHAATGAPNVDVYLNGATTPAIPDLAYGASTDFIELPTGEYTVQIRAAGEPARTAPLYETLVFLEGGASVEAVALGVVGGDPAFDVLFYDIDRTGTAGKARLYVIHAAAKAGAVDLYVNGKSVGTGVTFSEITPPLSADAGLINVAATAAGKRSPVIVRLVQAEIAADTIYTAIAVDGQDAPILASSGAISDAVAGKTGQIRITHASPGAPNVDIYLDGSPTAAVTDLAFKGSTDWITLPAKDFTVAIRPAGAAAVNLPVFTKTISVPADGAVEVVALGSLGGDPAFDVQTYTTNVGPTGGKVRLYVVHAATEAGAVDLRVNGKVIAKDVTFGAWTETPIEVEAGFVNVALTPAGKASPVLKRLTQGEVVANTTLTLVFVKGQDAPLILSTEQPAQVRLTNASQGAPDIDVYVDDALIFGGVPVGASTDLALLGTGERKVTIWAAGAAETAGVDPLLETTIAIPPGANLDLVAFGRLGGEPVFGLGVFPFDTSNPGKDKARVYVIHAAAGAGAVDIRLNGKVVVEGLEFGKASSALSVPAGIQNIAATPAGKGAPVLVRLTQFEFAGETIYVAVALDDEDAPALSIVNAD
ncbi:MAG TPA: DUF4397 domain-containing protein [Aggregatilineales bacterium]|nr:DUF4397 domain-containing protein [Aggregatilineales bacterium]